MTTDIDYKKILSDLAEATTARKLNLMEGTGHVVAGLGVGGGLGITEADASVSNIVEAMSGRWNPVERHDLPPSPPPPAPPGPDAPVTPLILDLDGDGVEAGGLAFFDHGGDGFYELSRWVSGDDGMLVWDRNDDGVINDGSELFGGNTVLTDGEKAANGFAALADLDSDGNGVVDDRDDNFSSLRILRWDTSNSADDNGGGGALRLVTLAQAGVGSLNTDYRSSDHVDDYGNEHRQVGSFTKADGTTATMTDVWFDTDTSATLYDAAGIPAHSESIAALPDITGGGRVYNLRDAMALDAIGELHAPFYTHTRTEKRTLEQLVSAFADAGMAGDESGRDALAKKIILRWTGAEGAVRRDYRPNSASFYFGISSPEQAAVVEAFMGHQWRSGKENRNPTSATERLFKANYEWHYERLHANLMLHTHLNDLWDAITVSPKEETGNGSSDVADYAVDLSGVKSILDGEDNMRIVEFLRAMKGIYGNSDFMLEAVRDVGLQWAYNNLDLFAELEREAIIGGAENEILSGVRDRQHRDIFDSRGGGDDTLYGYGGNDVYWLGHGTGNDRIDERRSNRSGDDGDEIRIKSDIKASDVRLRRVGSNLHVEIVGEGGEVSDSLTVKNHFRYEEARVEKVIFTDGTEWGLEDFYAVRIIGGEGRDILFGSTKQERRDIFDSHGGGDDILYGYGGDDVYWLGRGTGHDAIGEMPDNTFGDDGDEIRIKADIDKADVRWRRIGGNLHVQIVGEDGEVSDSLDVMGHFSRARARVEKLVFADGTEWDLEALADRIIGGAGDENLYGQGSDLRDLFDSHGGGNDTLYGEGGNDVYWLGHGTDHDTIDERDSNRSGDDGDEIRIKAGIDAADVRLRRVGNNLHVQIVGEGDEVSDSLAVKNHFKHAAARVEKVVFADGTEWGLEELGEARIVGGSQGQNLRGLMGREHTDIFDSHGGGNDTLYGYGGNDVYWLGYGTDHDRIDERDSNPDGDDGDEIRIKAGIDAGDVRWRRIGDSMHIQIVGEGGKISDSLEILNHFTDTAARVEKAVFADGTEWNLEEFIKRIVGTEANESLYGLAGEHRDVFDSHGGGNDTLYGYGGNDVYWLGRGTGNDTIDEGRSHRSGDDGDEIRIKAGIAVSDIRLRRTRDNLFVQIVGEGGEVSDSLTVTDHFTNTKARVEKVIFADGTEWGLEELSKARIVGGLGNDLLLGISGRTEVFDSSGGGNDTMLGFSGNDVYWLGRGTGNDTIDEWYGNPFGDDGDEIRIKAGIAVSDVRVRRIGDNMHVQILGEGGEVSDSLKIVKHFTDATARVEKAVFADGTEWDLEGLVERIVGTEANESLYGQEGRVRDLFDSYGGNDVLYGYGGNDVYWLGHGTGRDKIDERSGNPDGDDGDEIRIKAGIAVSDVRWLRIADNLYVQIVGEGGKVSDSLEVKDHFRYAASRVEKAIFADGTEWDLEALVRERIVGDATDNILFGTFVGTDVFDANGGGNDTLVGLSGNDVYWLGHGTGKDKIEERTLNSSGDDGDKIRIKAGIAMSDIRLRRIDNHLHVQIVGEGGEVSDSLEVQGHFEQAAAQVESIHAGGKVLLENQYQALINEMAAFGRGDSEFSDTDAIKEHYWRDDVALAAGN